MRKTLHYVILIFGIAACQKGVNPPDPPNPEPVTPPPPVAQTPDSNSLCTPFAQHIFVQRDRTHGDSALLQLPCTYSAQNNTEKYPLLIFLNGSGEASDHGNLSNRFEFQIGGKVQPVIVVCPQSENGFRAPHTTNEVIDYMIATYRVDITRIYLTGLSAGANSVLRYLTHKPQYAARIAAAAPLSSTLLDSTHRAQLHYISDAHVPLDWFCGDDDKKFRKANEAYANTINTLTPGLVQFQLYNGAHGNWNIMYNPTHKYYNPNIYEWLLQHSK